MTRTTGKLKWTDKWHGYYDACRKFCPELNMEDCAKLADEYIGKNLSKVDKETIDLSWQTIGFGMIDDQPITAMPKTCYIWKDYKKSVCGEPIVINNGFHVCQVCLVSYGPVKLNPTIPEQPSEI